MLRSSPLWLPLLLALVQVQAHAVPPDSLPMPAVPVPSDVEHDATDARTQLEELRQQGLADTHPAIATLLKLLGLKPKPVPAPKVSATPEQQTAIDASIANLASDDYHTREAALLSLVEIGEPALSSLEQATHSSDAEVRFRADQLARMIRSRVFAESRLLTEHNDIVWTVAFSHNGRFLASGGGGRHANGQWSAGDDFKLRIWNVAEGKVIRTIEGHTSTVNRVVWSQRDFYLLTASSDSSARILRLRDGSEYRIFRGHEGSVTHALFNPAEKEVVTASWDKTIRIWDVNTGKELRKINWPEGRVWGLALSPDGTTIAACGDSPVIRLYDYATGQVQGELRGHGNNAVTVAFSPDGSQLVSGGWDNSVRVWNVKERKSTRQWNDAAGRVEGVAWSPDGNFVVAGNLDASIRVYDVAKGTLVRVYQGHEQSVSKVDVSPLGNLVASGGWDSAIRLWTTRGWAPAAAAMEAQPPLAPPGIRVPPLPR
jgi:WD40 repeat protein